VRRPTQKNIEVALKQLGESITSLGQHFHHFAPQVTASLAEPENTIEDDDGREIDVRLAKAGLPLRFLCDKLHEVISHLDDCYAHLKMTSPLTEWRSNQPREEFCDWCEHLGRKSLAAGGWSMGDNAVRLCQPHQIAFMSGMGETTEEASKVSNHEAIHAWQAAGYPDPKEFFRKWREEHS
jgi:hypothetical protein